MSAVNINGTWLRASMRVSRERARAVIRRFASRELSTRDREALETANAWLDATDKFFGGE